MHHTKFFQVIDAFYNKNHASMGAGISSMHLRELSEELFQKTAIRLPPQSNELRHFLEAAIKANRFVAITGLRYG